MTTQISFSLNGDQISTEVKDHWTLLHLLREEMGLTNVKLMIPFCRTVDEGKAVLKEMKKNGLERGKNKLQVYVMCEIPSNVLLAVVLMEQIGPIATKIYGAFLCSRILTTSP